MSNGQAQKKAEKPKKKFAEVVPEPTKKTELEQKVKLLTKEMKKLNNQLDNWFELLDWYRDYYGAPSDWSQEYFVYAMLTAGGKPQQEMLGLLEDVNKTLAKKEKLFKKLEGLGLSNFTATQNQKIKNQYLDLYWLKGPKWEAIIDTTTQMVEDKLKELEPKPLTSEEGGPTISGQKGPVIPWKERPPDLTLPVYGDLVFLFPGVPEVYIDSSCGPNPVDAATLEICRTYEAIEMGDVELKKQLKEKQNMIMDAIILMIPVVGSVYMIGLDVHEIKSKKELVKHAEELQKELDKNRDIMTDADILMTEMLIQQYKDAAPNWKDYAWLAFDFVGLGLDAAFATQILVRTTARWKGTKALKVLEAEGGVGKTTQVEKDLFAQAAVELGEQAEDMYNIAAKKKGGWYQVSTELAEDAKKAKAAGKGDGTITKQIMLDYIEKNPIQKSGKLKKVGQKALDLTVGDLGAMGGKKNFYKKMV